MKTQIVTIQSDNQSYPVTVGMDLFVGIAQQIKKILPTKPNKIVVFSDDVVFSFYGADLRKALQTEGFDSLEWIIPHGEGNKTWLVAEQSLDFFSKSRLTRSDLVLALGGGVVGDIAGFCSAVYRRGIPIVQIPTSLLAMVDSSVGSKTGINNQFGKNMIGAFHHPKAVFADVGVLKTLETREIRSGCYELIKHGAIGGFPLFTKTKNFLESYPLDSFSDNFGDDGFESALIDLISDQISQKASVVSQDQHEDIYRADRASRKVLNFGHTVGHALERATGYEFFRHGEAVGYGMLAASEIAKRLEISDENSINLLNDVVVRVGALPDTSDIDVESVFKAIEYDKKSAGKSVQWVLLESIGVPRIVSGENVPSSIVRESLKWVLHK